MTDQTECRQAVIRLREGIASLDKLGELAGTSDATECRRYLFQICTVASALSDFAGASAEALDEERGESA